MAKPKISASSALPVTASHRRSTTSGYARGEETKLRIVTAALELFAANGYEQTSTRDIAARAGVNSPALQYYFDGKNGLYLACAEHMAQLGFVLMEPAMASARTVLAGKPNLDTLIECVWTIVEGVADAALLTREVDAWTRFVAWEEVRQEKSSQLVELLMEKGFRKELRTLLQALVGKITGRQPNDPVTRIRAVTLMGQVTVFLLQRQKSLGEIGWDHLDESRLVTLKAVIRSQTIAILKDAAIAEIG